MSQANLRNSSGNPYLYLEGSSGSLAAGIDTTANDIFNIVVSSAATDIDPTSGTPSLSIDPNVSGNISFSPQLPFGQSTFINGDVEILSGNLEMQDTTAAGLVGVIEFDGNRFIHNFGADNTFIGELSGNFSLTGAENVAVGTNALKNITDSSNMTAIGYNALAALTSGASNTAIGKSALSSGVNISQNTAIGANALAVFNSSAVGGGLNTAVGNISLASNATGRFNTALGCETLTRLTGHSGNDNFNTAVGCEAGSFLTGGANNTLVGANAGSTLVSGLATGGNNIIVGAFAGQNYTAAETSNILIGNVGTAAENNTIRIGDGTTQTKFFATGVNGVSVTAAGSVVISSTGQLGTTAVAAPGITWSVITADQTAAVNNGYICNKGSALLLALPTTSAAGTIVRVTGINTALGFKVTQAAGQQIFFGTTQTTSGVTGFIQSSAIRDSIEMVCVVADLTWNVISSIGNPTVN